MKGGVMLGPRRRFFLATFAVLVTVVATVAAQSGRTAEPDVLNALLTEVRGLRAAMEQMSSAGPRVQLALGRLQLQEQRVNTMLHRVEVLREAIAKGEKENAAAQEQLATMKKMLGGDKAETDDNPIAQMLKGAQSGLSNGAADVERLKAEEAQLQQQIAVEQGRWTEINRTLEELERTLAKR
jgi:chromosome segregation ATPase